MKALCGESLNEAADVLAFAAALADDSPLPSRLHLETNLVHLCINDATVEWGARLRDSLAHRAELGQPKRRRDRSKKRHSDACPDNNSLDVAAGPEPAGPRQGFVLQEN